MPLADHGDNLAQALAQMFPGGVHRKTECGHDESDHSVLSVEVRADPGVTEGTGKNAKVTLPPGTRYEVRFDCKGSFGTSPRTGEPEVHGACAGAVVIPD